MRPFSEVLVDPNRTAALRAVQRWLELFISKAVSPQGVVGNRHDEYGRGVTQPMFDRHARPAHVCPFVADSIDRDLCWIEEYHSTEEADILAVLRRLMDEFCNADPAFDPLSTGTAAGYPHLWKAFVAVFPYVMHASGPMALFDGIHRGLKGDFMDRGLMLGQFYRGCSQEGIYNPAFRPLLSPYPLFAIRYMARHDHLFFDPSNRRHADAYQTFFQ